MKSILTFLFVSFAIMSTNAQGNFDVANVSTTTNSTDRITHTFSEHSIASTTGSTAHNIAKKGISIMPNAATKDVKIIFKTDKAATATVIVLDQNGKNILHQEAQITEGNNNINIDNFHNLNDGTYSIQLTTNNETYTSTFIIWK